MANKSNDSTAYINFIEDLNEILLDINIHKLSYF